VKDQKTLSTNPEIMSLSSERERKQKFAGAKNENIFLKTWICNTNQTLFMIPIKHYL